MLGYILPRGVFSYAVMPQIMPRLKDLLTGGFGQIPFLFATIYQMVGLLPQNHPYIQSYNIGRFGVRHVIAEAGNNIQLKLKNLDQIILFLVILVGVVLFIVQLCSLSVVLFLQPAVAAISNPLAPVLTNWNDFFVNPPAFRRDDIAGMMLDMVFGVPRLGGPDPSTGAIGMFESCVSTPGLGLSAMCQDNFGLPLIASGLATTPIAGFLAQFSPLAPGAASFFPFPFHDAMHRLFSVYSTGLLVVGVIIALYFMATVVAETAQSGIPFGRRFNKTWAPIRIVVAFGLLIPFGIGLNASQYIVLFSAKYGSAFASNGWRYFNDTISTRYLGFATDSQRLVSTPYAPENRVLPHFMFVAQTCRYVYEFLDLQRRRQEAEAAGTAPPPSLTVDQQVHAYAISEHNRPLVNSSVRLRSTTGVYQTVVNPAFLPRGSSYYTIRFGVRDETRFRDYRGFVSPVCGEIQMPLTDGRPYSSFTAGIGPPQSYLLSEPGPGEIQEAYHNLVLGMWHADINFGGALFSAVSSNFWQGLSGVSGIPHLLTVEHRWIELANRVVQGLPTNGAEVDPFHDTPVDPVFVQQAIDRVGIIMRAEIQNAVNAQLASARWGGAAVCGSTPSPATADLCTKGWAGAGIWYNRIAELNGAVTTAAYATPIISRFPAVMEKVAEIKKQYDENVSYLNRFKPEVSGVDDITPLLGDGFDSTLAKTLYTAFTEWNTSAGRSNEPSGNAFLAAVSSVFGLDGLFSMRDNTQTHPLALLSGIGRSLVESAIRSLGLTAMMVTAGLVFDGLPGQVAGVGARFFVMVAMIGLTIGFVLFYVVPFLPFLYFFFAVGGWIKGIFEALVGAPLWALAHIRIDGNGLPGNAALNGYFLIFEVFLRPILIVFGLLASISTYSALVSVLNSVFDLVIQNAAGYDLESEMIAPQNTLTYMRSYIDEFFYTVIYAIVVYMLGMSSFKLIDTIPNNILRWMGQSVATFNDQREDVAQALVSKASIGSQQVVSRIGGGLSQAVNSATSAR